MRILIIEDNIGFVNKLLTLLEQESTGLEEQLLITTTGDAQVGLKLLEQRWTHILIDHDLPERWSGWQLLNNTMFFRNEDKAKIIAISAVPENNVRLIQHGAQYAVSKMDAEFADKIMEIIVNEK